MNLLQKTIIEQLRMIKTCMTFLAISFTAMVAVGDELSVIAFGSCAREREEQPIWTEIIKKNPELFLFIGDNHYADFWEKDGKLVMRPVPNVERLREAYRTLGQQPGYQLMKQHCPIMATWDDHDYGANDMGNDFQLRNESQSEFLDFFGFGPTDPIRKQQGIYHAKVFGESGKRVQVIMLDTRFHRDPLERAPRGESGGGPYRPTTDTAKTILGEQQWAWLAEQLRQPADVRIVASSIQVVADEHHWETWGNMPHERERLYRLIEKTGASGVVFVSGDRHLLEISRDASRGVPYPIWDFTSSGLTQKKETIVEANKFRVGPVYRETNFGIVRINWGDSLSTTTIDLEGFGNRGQLLTRQTIFLDQLR